MWEKNEENADKIPTSTSRKHGQEFRLKQTCDITSNLD